MHALTKYPVFQKNCIMILNAFMKIYDLTFLNGTCKSFQTNVYLIFVKRAFTPKKISGAREDLEYASNIALHQITLKDPCGITEISASP